MNTRLSRTVRRLFLMPLGLVAFAIVGVAAPTPGLGFALMQTPAAAQDHSQGDRMTEDMVTRILTQGGAVAVLLVVLWSYRRDFFRKLEDKGRELQERRDEKDTLQGVLNRSTAAITSSVLASTNQTSATHRLARTVEAIERKMDERRRMDGGG